MDAEEVEDASDDEQETAEEGARGARGGRRLITHSSFKNSMIGMCVTTWPPVLPYSVPSCMPPQNSRTPCVSSRDWNARKEPSRWRARFERTFVTAGAGKIISNRLVFINHAQRAGGLVLRGADDLAAPYPDSISLRSRLLLSAFLSVS